MKNIYLIILTTLILCGNLFGQTVVKMNMPQQADKELNVVSLFDEDIPEGIPVILGVMGYNVDGGIMPYSFEWKLNGQTASTNDILTFTPNKGDNLSLNVKDDVGCRASTSFNLKVARLDPSPDLNNIEQNIEIYPTVVTNFVNVKIPESKNGKTIIKIFDIGGKLIKSKQISESETINIKLNPGVYFISAEVNETHVVRKIIVK